MKDIEKNTSANYLKINVKNWIAHGFIGGVNSYVYSISMMCLILSIIVGSVSLFIGDFSLFAHAIIAAIVFGLSCLFNKVVNFYLSNKDLQETMNQIVPLKDNTIVLFKDLLDIEKSSKNKFVFDVRQAIKQSETNLTQDQIEAWDVFLDAYRLKTTKSVRKFIKDNRQLIQDCYSQEIAQHHANIMDIYKKQYKTMQQSRKNTFYNQKLKEYHENNVNKQK